jgi:hypothetical protein
MKTYFFLRWIALEETSLCSNFYAITPSGRAKTRIGYTVLDPGLKTGKLAPLGWPSVRGSKNGSETVYPILVFALPEGVIA